MLTLRTDITSIAALSAMLALTGCQLVVDFDRDRIPDDAGQSDGGDMDADTQRPDGGPDDGGPNDGGATCGNSIVEAGEDCDDGMNGDDADGCTDACEFTCTTNADCTNDLICDGEEVCNTETHVCEEGDPAADGVECDTDRVCFNGDCIEPICGNSIIEPGEQCDDGMNGDDADGCTDTCMLTCVTDSDCSDLDDQCVTGSCVDAMCVPAPANEGNSCDDGDLCTVGDVCSSGSCEPGLPPDCSAEDGMCAVGVCDPADGECVAMPANEGDPCDDGNLCTLGETCSAGACGGGTAPDCSAEDGMCTVGVCDPSDGGCVAMPANEGDPCDDSDMCTSNTICTAGVCGGGTALDCTVTSDCQVGACDPTMGCVTMVTNEGGACDDGDPCTINTTCSAGTCVNPTPLCPADEACSAGTCSCGSTNGSGTSPACGGGTPICTDAATGECVECVDATDCPGSEVCVSNACQVCDPGTNAGCSTGAPFCIGGTECVECATDADCDSSMSETCETGMCVSP